ncbi:hypothetical protein ARMGADRAFT_936445, partial [Armillaria gallica]
CQATALHTHVQEQQSTDQMDTLITHDDDDHFVINIFGLHNATQLHEAFSKTLVTPSALDSDCEEHHKKLAAKLLINQSVKCQRTQEK